MILQIAERECVVILPAQCVCVMLCMSGRGETQALSSFLVGKWLLTEKGWGEIGGSKKKKCRGRCFLQLGNNKANQHQQEQSYKLSLNLSQGTRRDLLFWQCICDISRCKGLCYLVNNNEVGVVLKVLFAA